MVAMKQLVREIESLPPWDTPEEDEAWADL